MEGIYLTKPNRISEKELDQYVSTIEGKTEIQFTHNVPNKLLDLNKKPLQCVKLDSGPYDDVQPFVNNPVDTSVSGRWSLQHKSAEPMDVKNSRESMPAFESVVRLLM